MVMPSVTMARPFGPFLVAGGDAAILREPADQPLDLVALAIGGLVELEPVGLVLAGRDHRLDPAPPEAAAHGRAGIAPITRYASATRPASAAGPAIGVC